MPFRLEIANLVDLLLICFELVTYFLVCRSKKVIGGHR